MLNLLKEIFVKEELLSGAFGIERETLRVKQNGELAITDHPEVFGDKLRNTYITTDFSESQIEVITPALKTTKEVYDFLSGLYDIVATQVGDEYLWPQSMPCDIPEDGDIPIAKYREDEDCKQARAYRERLFKKYGGKKQLISGIHFNFSFEENLFKKLYLHEKPQITYPLFKDQIYLKIARNYLRYRWLMIYLTGAAPAMHKSYPNANKNQVISGDGDSFTHEGTISYRNGEEGYQNAVDLFPDYTSTSTYIQSIERFIKEDAIQSYKELYSQVRPKAKDNDNLLESLEQQGIQYIEIRSIDINPFDKTGITLEDLDFIHLFNLYLLVKEESNYKMWQQEALFNQRMIAQEGQKDVKLKKDGQEVSRLKWSLELLKEMKEMSQELGLGKEDLVERMIYKVVHPEETYAFQIVEKIKKQGYLEAHLELARGYKLSAYRNRYKLQGYEDMELSTQILMKEAIKRGIKVEVIDREDNFIVLSKKNKIEYIKQATKTSKDSYMTMLMMENKVVTKKILEKHGVCVPQGIEVTSISEIDRAAARYEYKPVVIKPKSTNFGTGISIFPEGAHKEDLIGAFKIGFEHDKTVLLEEFAKGKEYRFLVIGEEVVGILHRVPANVMGDGIKSITELVAIKNEDALRGEGYKTPLEKIKLDASSKLFLKQNNLDFSYVPKEGELVYLRENSNISTGGDSIDFTDVIPDKFKKIAVEAAKSVEAKFCGVDMMLEDCTSEESPYSIIELNFNPAIHIHSFPYKGKERNIARYILQTLELL